jgi:hypothetical protein
MIRPRRLTRDDIRNELIADIDYIDVPLDYRNDAPGLLLYLAIKHRYGVVVLPNQKLPLNPRGEPYISFPAPEPLYQSLVDIGVRRDVARRRSDEFVRDGAQPRRALERELKDTWKGIVKQGYDDDAAQRALSFVYRWHSQRFSAERASILKDEYRARRKIR